MIHFSNYLSWRGDLDFRAVPPRETDVAIFAKLAYFPFPESLKGDGEGKATLKSVYESSFDRALELPPLLQDTADLLTLAAGTSRFGRVRMCEYVDRLDPSNLIQFSAVTFLVSSRIGVIAFRGTDDSLTGWREDFQLAFKPNMPSQTYAADYIRHCAKTYPNLRWIICGHSKGGNLAVYGASQQTEEIKQKISAVYDFDGPGFREEFLNSESFLSILGILRHYIPEASVVGCLFEHRGRTTVVRADERGIRQHYLATWQIMGPSFIEAESRTRDSIQIEHSIKAWTQDMTEEETEAFVNSLFDLFSISEISKFSELSKLNVNGLKLLTKGTSEQRKSIQSGLGKLLFELYRTYFPKFSPKKNKEIESAELPSKGGK